MAEASSNDILWRLREGGRHDREFGPALAALIFLRWADFQESEQEAIAAFNDTDYQPALKTSLHWRSWCNFRQDKLSHFLKKTLPSALRSPNNDRSHTLATHLYRLITPLKELSRFSPEELETMVLWVADQPFETPNDRRKLLNFFDEFLNATTYRLSGEFRTPPGIAALMAELAAPTVSERIYDPSFGMAGLLTAAYDYVRRHEKGRFGQGIPAVTICGAEPNPYSYIIGLTRLVLSGIEEPQLELGNSLERKPFNDPQSDGFDVVLANLPWGMRGEKILHKEFPVRTSNANSLFIQHALSLLRPGGRAALIVPQGFLFRAGMERNLRHWLVEEYTVESIVDLPANVFLPYTSIKAAILLIRHGGPTESIRMVDGAVYFDQGKASQPTIISIEQAEKLARDFRLPQPPKSCWDVNVEALIEVEWDFTPRRRDLSSLDLIMNRLKSKVEVVPLKSCCMIKIGRVVEPEELVDEISAWNRYSSALRDLRVRLDHLNQELDLAISKEQQVALEIEREQSAIGNLELFADLSDLSSYELTEISELMETITNLNERIRALTQKYQDKSKQLEDLGEQRRRVSEQIDNMRREKLAKRDRFQQIGLTKQLRDEKSHQLLLDLADSNEVLEKLTEDYRQYSRQVEELSYQCLMLSENITNVHSEGNALHNKLPPSIGLIDEDRVKEFRKQLSVVLDIKGRIEELSKRRQEISLNVERLNIETKSVWREIASLDSPKNLLNNLTEDLPTTRPIPYIRIKDIQRGYVSRGSSWVLPSSSITGEEKLRSGDILLSKSGTIGKAGIVRNGAVGGIAASGLFVLRPEHDRLDPHFLLAYLQSSECRAWLADKARGSNILHQSKRVLDALPIPLPHLQLQQRVAQEYRDHGVDALTLLTELLIEGKRDPIAELINKYTEILPANIDSISDPLDLTLLDRLATEVQTIRNEAAHGRRIESPLAPWILQFGEAVSGLRGILNVPRGPALFGLLQEASRKLMMDALGTVMGKLPSEAKARNLTLLLDSWLGKACLALLIDIRIVLKIDEGSIQAGEVNDISLQVHNQGSLPLRDISITTEPDWGGTEIGYLSENSKVAVTLAGVSPNVAGTFNLAVNWSASILDGQRVDGSSEIALHVVESNAQEMYGQAVFGGSPYVCGDPVRPERNDVFFGRNELIDQIRRQIIQSGNVVLLEGNRRSGKSSILWHLEGSESIPGWMGVYCSFQGAEGSQEAVGVPTVEIFRAIAICIAKSLKTLGGETPLPDGTILPPNKKLGIVKACVNGINAASAFSDFRDYVEVALEKLTTRDLGLLLLLDEFDKLQEGINSGVTSPQVPENIRFLVQTYPHFSAILTGQRRLKRLREEYWSALFGLGTRFGVTSLPVEAARRLVTEPVKKWLIYSNEAIERAIALVARQPYLLQCLCNRIFDMAAQLKIRSITITLVEQAADALVEDNEHFASLWGYAGSDRRRFILFLCHKETASPDSLRLGVILELLLSHGIDVDEETLIADLEFLIELELIKLVGESSGGHYALTIPLMGTWIERQQDFAVVKSKAKLETEDQHE